MYRRNVNIFSQESLKHTNVTPEELYSKFARPINQIDQYIQKEDRLCLKAKRDFRKNVRSSSQFTDVHSHGLIDIEARSGSRATKRILEDFYLPGMPFELMTVNSKRKMITKKKKKKSKKDKKRTNEGENEASSEDEKGDKSDSGSDREELDSNSSAAGDEAGDYADTYFDNGEDYIASDNSGGEGEYY